MNIFAFDDDVKLSSLWIDDVRKNKMILESCQMLSHAVGTYAPNKGYKTYSPFKMIGYAKHPCTQWVMESYDNFMWLCDYTQSCIVQRNKPHKCYDILQECRRFANEQFKTFPSLVRTPFANCAANQSVGVSYKHIPNTCAAYRMYIRDRWSLDTIKLTWNHGEKPWWI